MTTLRNPPLLGLLLKCAVATVYSFSAQALATPEADLVPSRIQGIAPLAVHFDAIGSTDPQGKFDSFREYNYQFDFGDPDSGEWEYSGASKNEQVGGPLSAHLYVQPGSYSASVTVSDPDGGESTKTIEIRVTDPDRAFAGSKTVCLSRSDDFDGCPQGAQKTKSVSKWPRFRSNMRYMLRSGEDFTSLGRLVVGQIETAQITSFGLGEKPKVEAVFLQKSSRKSKGKWIDDVRVIGLETGAVLNHITGSNLLIFNNTIVGTSGEIHLGSAFGWHKKKGHYPDTLTLPKNNFVIENTNLGPLQKAFGRGQMVWMGNHFDNAWEHNIRLWQIYKTVVSHNKLEGTGPDPDRPGRSNIKIHSAGLDPVGIDDNQPIDIRLSSQYLVAANNVFGSEHDEGVWNTISYKPQNSSEVEGLSDAIIENNVHICSSFPGFTRTGTFGGRNIIQRNSKVKCKKTSNQLNSATSNNVKQLPDEWDGPYFVDGKSYRTR